MIDTATWDVCASTPPATQKDKSKLLAYRSNVRACVVAMTAERAIELTQKKYPGAVIHSLQRRGEITIFDEQLTEDA